MLFNLVVALIISFVEGGWTSGVGDGSAAACCNAGQIALLWSAANVIPSLSVGARRLHDIGRSGWWRLIVPIPLIVWLAGRTRSERNRFDL